MTAGHRAPRCWENQVERLTLERDAALREADRLRHGEPIEGDFVCPHELAADALRAELDATKRERDQYDEWFSTVDGVVADHLIAVGRPLQRGANYGEAAFDLPDELRRLRAELDAVRAGREDDAERLTLNTPDCPAGSCYDCGGSGYVKIKCDGCGGEGTVEPE